MQSPAPDVSTSASAISRRPQPPRRLRGGVSSGRGARGRAGGGGPFLLCDSAARLAAATYALLSPGLREAAFAALCLGDARAASLRSRGSPRQFFTRIRLDDGDEAHVPRLGGG